MHFHFISIKLALRCSVVIHRSSKMIVARVFIVTAFGAVCLLSALNFHCVLIVFVSIFRVKVLI